MNQPAPQNGAAAPLVIAHRGASAYAPEHTLAAFDLALEMGAEYIEQDLQMTADGVLVVLHDATLERTTRGNPRTCTGEVSAKTLAEVRECDAGVWFNERYPERARPEFVGMRVPTMDEVLTRYSGRARFYIETKNPEDAPGMEEALSALLTRHHLHDGHDAGGPRDSANSWRPPHRVVIQSFSEASLRKMHELAPGLPLVLLLDSESARVDIEGAIERAAAYAVGLGPHREDVDESIVRAAHAHRLVVHPYTVNTEAEMRRLINAEVDGMFTDDPALLLRVRASTTID
jgi:glycerophosphoryl diester phosphodiesterase